MACDGEHTEEEVKTTRKEDSDLAVRTWDVLSLCSGVNGIELGLRLLNPAARSVCHVEGEGHVVSSIVSRMEEGRMDQAPVWSDLRTFDARPWRGVVDCVAAGFPCQPVSRAGRRQGRAHSHWLWDDVLRCVDDADANCVFLENVDALRGHGGRRVVDDLAAGGYRVAWDLFSARAVGAPHLRPRLFILAAKRDGLHDAVRGRHRLEAVEVLAGREAAFPPDPRTLSAGTATGWPEPGVRRGPDGAAPELDKHRLRACGNAVVPLVAAHAFRTLAGRLMKHEQANGGGS